MKGPRRRGAGVAGGGWRGREFCVDAKILFFWRASSCGWRVSAGGVYLSGDNPGGRQQSRRRRRKRRRSRRRRRRRRRATR